MIQMKTPTPRSAMHLMPLSGLAIETGLLAMAPSFTLLPLLPPWGLCELHLCISLQGRWLFSIIILLSLSSRRYPKRAPTDSGTSRHHVRISSSQPSSLESPRECACNLALRARYFGNPVHRYLSPTAHVSIQQHGGRVGGFLWRWRQQQDVSSRAPNLASQVPLPCLPACRPLQQDGE